jgi:hypothetical protein
VTLLYLDGFAHQNLAGRYMAGSAVNVGGGWKTDGAASAPQPYWIAGPQLKRAVTASTEVFTGVRFKMTSLVAGDILVQVLGDAGATTHLTVNINASGNLQLYRGSQFGTLLGAGTAVLAANAWRYVELRATIADSGGIAQVRVDGALDINVTGDTKNAGTATTIDAVSIGNTQASFGFTDWYVSNAAGTAPANTWFGDTVVRTLVPTGDGDVSQLVGSDGNSVANWQQVDELPPNGTDYNGSPTVGNQDTYAVTDLPAGVAPVGVQVSMKAAASDTSSAVNGISLLRLSGTDYPGTTRALSTTYTEWLETYDKNPATSGTWTAPVVNAAQAGMRVG